MHPFIPQQILVEAGVTESPMAQRIMRQFPNIEPLVIEDYRNYKAPFPITAAKKLLMVAEAKGQALKPFPKIPHALNLGDYVFNPISNCHLECTYCILQSYLKNNPALTIFANLDHFFVAIENKVRSLPDQVLRFGTGELSDSLALDDLTALSAEFVPFFSKLPNAFLELKTKSDCVGGLLEIEHGGHTVISWSMSPSFIARHEELKCASTLERLKAAARVQRAGYPVGIHLDPVIYFEEWKEAYRELVYQISAELDPHRLAWVSIGTLRFDKNLKEIAMSRFPQTKIFCEDFIEAPDGKMRYFKSLRREIYRSIWGWLKEWSDDFPRYLCMEPPWIWEGVTGSQSPAADEMELKLTRRLQFLSK